MDSDGELTAPADLAANNHKIVRKSAKGRKLMRWGPDEDQQLLLATEAVVIEGAVELDWNLVGEKMPQMVTGEAIKQHLYKVREARESAGMTTPAKGEGKSAFGTRRGVTRYPPVDPNAIPDQKKRSRPESKTPRGRGKAKAKPEDDDEEEFIEKKQKIPSKIKHRSLLYGPAVPKELREEASLSPAPAGHSLIVKLNTRKRKAVKEEPDQQAGATATTTTNTPKAPRKHTKKVKILDTVLEDGSPVEKDESPAKEDETPAKKRGRMSNFNYSDFKEDVKHDSQDNQILTPRKGEQSGHVAKSNKEVAKAKGVEPSNGILTPHKEQQNGPATATKLKKKAAKGSKEANADIRNSFKLAPKKDVEPKPIPTVDAPVRANRALRNKSTHIDYREQEATLSEDVQSMFDEVDVNGEDDEYQPDIPADDEPALDIKYENEQRFSVLNAAEKPFDDAIDLKMFQEAIGPEAEQKNYQAEQVGILQPASSKVGRLHGEQDFTKTPNFLGMDALVPDIDFGRRMNFTGGSPAGNPSFDVLSSTISAPTVPHDNAHWNSFAQWSAPAPGPGPGPASMPTQATPFAWANQFGGDQGSGNPFDSFLVNNDWVSHYDHGDDLVEQLYTDQNYSGGQSMGAYAVPGFNDQWDTGIGDGGDIEDVMQ